MMINITQPTCHTILQEQFRHNVILQVAPEPDPRVRAALMGDVAKEASPNDREHDDNTNNTTHTTISYAPLLLLLIIVSTTTATRVRSNL